MGRFCISKYRSGIYEVLLCTYVLNSHFPDQISLKNVHTKCQHIQNQDNDFRIFTPVASKHGKETTSIYEVYRSQSKKPLPEQLRNICTPLRGCSETACQISEEHREAFVLRY